MVKQKIYSVVIAGGQENFSRTHTRAHAFKGQTQFSIVFWSFNGEWIWLLSKFLCLDLPLLLLLLGSYFSFSVSLSPFNVERRSDVRGATKIIRSFHDFHLSKTFRQHTILILFEFTLCIQLSHVAADAKGGKDEVNNNISVKFIQFLLVRETN